MKKIHLSDFRIKAPVCSALEDAILQVIDSTTVLSELQLSIQQLITHLTELSSTPGNNLEATTQHIIGAASKENQPLLEAALNLLTEHSLYYVYTELNLCYIDYLSGLTPDDLTQFIEQKKQKQTSKKRKRNATDDSLRPTRKPRPDEKLQSNIETEEQELTITLLMTYIEKVMHPIGLLTPNLTDTTVSDGTPSSSSSNTAQTPSAQSSQSSSSSSSSQSESDSSSEEIQSDDHSSIDHQQSDASHNTSSDSDNEENSSDGEATHEIQTELLPGTLQEKINSVSLEMYLRRGHLEVLFHPLEAFNKQICLMDLLSCAMHLKNTNTETSYTIVSLILQHFRKETYINNISGLTHLFPYKLLSTEFKRFRFHSRQLQTHTSFAQNLMLFKIYNHFDTPPIHHGILTVLKFPNVISHASTDTQIQLIPHLLDSNQGTSLLNDRVDFLLTSSQVSLKKLFLSFFQKKGDGVRYFLSKISYHNRSHTELILQSQAIISIAALHTPSNRLMDFYWRVEGKFIKIIQRILSSPHYNRFHLTIINGLLDHANGIKFIASHAVTILSQNSILLQTLTHPAIVSKIKLKEGLYSIFFNVPLANLILTHHSRTKPIFTRIFIHQHSTVQLTKLIMEIPYQNKMPLLLLKALTDSQAGTQFLMEKLEEINPHTNYQLLITLLNEEFLTKVLSNHIHSEFFLFLISQGFTEKLRQSQKLQQCFLSNNLHARIGLMEAFPSIFKSLNQNSLLEKKPQSTDTFAAIIKKQNASLFQQHPNCDALETYLQRQVSLSSNTNNLAEPGL